MDEARAALGKKRLVFAIHASSFPSDADEDVGVGSPGTCAAARLFELVRELGFTSVQLGPEGETSREMPSPYDSTVFSRGVATIAHAAYREGGPLEGLVDAQSLTRAIHPGTVRADHRLAHDATHALARQAFRVVRDGTSPRAAEVAAAVSEFARTQAAWLDGDALSAALAPLRAAPADLAPSERDLWDPPAGEEARYAARRAALSATHAAFIDEYVFNQWAAHADHARVRAMTRALGLGLYSDLQVGFAPRDVWTRSSAFLPGYYLGAPPSRTNPEGQPWHYPVLHPGRFGDLDTPEAALTLVQARAEKAFAEYEGLRIDHPHGLVCPWVYRADHEDPGRAVREGARLFESPDLADHPRLAAFARVGAEDIDRSQERYADHWANTLRPEQVERYAVLFDAVMAAAERHGRSQADVTCEVLSTQPEPLRAVLARLGLGRWRVTQKANLMNASDVYRTENATPADWVMIGNHDTASIWALLRSWDDSTRTAWSAHVCARLGLADSMRHVVAASDGLLGTAMFAELLVCPAEHVMVFFADLFGVTERFNRPGTVDDDNWTLRLPSNFAQVYEARLARAKALDLPLAFALAIAARGDAPDGLVERLLERAGAAKTGLVLPSRRS